jgi:ZIP family zinc transporter
MIEWFVGLYPVTQALLATGFTWLMTAVGAALVLVFKSINRRLLDGMLGSAAGKDFCV